MTTIIAAAIPTNDVKQQICKLQELDGNMELFISGTPDEVKKAQETIVTFTGNAATVVNLNNPKFNALLPFLFSKFDTDLETLDKVHIISGTEQGVFTGVEARWLANVDREELLDDFCHTFSGPDKDIFPAFADVCRRR